MRLLISLSLLVFSMVSLLGQVQKLPKALILTTGGTIASRVDAPLVEGHQLISALPELKDYAEINVKEVFKEN